MKEKGQGERGKHCPSEETGPRGLKGGQPWWCWNKRLRWTLVTHGEAAYGVHEGTQRGTTALCWAPQFVTDHGSCPFPVSRNWSEARQEIQARLYWGLCCSMGKWDQLCKWRGQACSLMGWGEEYLQGSWLHVQGACAVPCFCSRHPVFALGAYKLASGVLVSVFWGPEFTPSVHACCYLPSHIVCLHFVAGEEVYPDASSVALQERVPGPSLSQFWKWTFFLLSSLNCQLLLYITATVFKNWFYILQLFLLHTGFSGGFACNS